MNARPRHRLVCVLPHVAVRFYKRLTKTSICRFQGETSCSTRLSVLQPMQMFSVSAIDYGDIIFVLNKCSKGIPYASFESSNQSSTVRGHCAAHILRDMFDQTICAAYFISLIAWRVVRFPAPTKCEHFI